MSTYLADANLLVALTVVDHVHHDVAIEWFQRFEPDLATCPITEGALVRLLLREGDSATDAVDVLDAIRAQPWHTFWPDSIWYTHDVLVGVIGHRQVTDAYLVGLAQANHARLATFDRGLAALHGEAIHLLET